jgi:hypothetical protein
MAYIVAKHAVQMDQSVGDGEEMRIKAIGVNRKASVHDNAGCRGSTA